MRFLILAALFCACIAVPLQKQQQKGPQPVQFIGNVSLPLHTGPIPACSMKLTEAQLKSGIPHENMRWRGGLIMQMDWRFNEGERVLINNALYELHNSICIDVLLWPVDAQPSGDYVFINRGDPGTGCWSYVGKLGGRQDLNLEAPGCVHHGVAIHESIHALGFLHEQSRPDRDQFVEILWGNIDPPMQYNFDVAHDTWTFDVPYDYTSIMHYNSHDFSWNGQPTIRAWNGQPVGSNYVLTGYDRDKLWRMYC